MVAADEPRFPELPEPFASALRDLVDWVEARFDVIGLLASGTIVRGTPDPSSDLDTYVIVRGGGRQRIQRFFRGVPAEIFVNTPATVEAALERDREQGRLLTAHMVATGVVMLDRDPAIAAIRAQAQRLLDGAPDLDENKLTLYRYTCATHFEDGFDVVERDPAACAFLLSMAVHETLEYAFWKANRWVPRWKDVLLELAEVDAELAGLMRRFLAAPVLAERVEIAGCIADHALGTRGFFEWESPMEET